MLDVNLFLYQFVTNMKHHPLLNYIPLVLLITVYVAQGTLMNDRYRKLELGGNIIGTTGEKLSTRSKIQCSSR